MQPPGEPGEPMSLPYTDAQTDLPNRELFLDRLEMAVLRSFRYPDRRFAVMSIAIAQYDHIEAAHGYEATADVLKEFARRLKTVVRNYDSAAHIAGDQFAVLLESIKDDSDPARVSNRLHDALRERIITRFGEFILSAQV